MRKGDADPKRLLSSGFLARTSSKTPPSASARTLPGRPGRPGGGGKAGGGLDGGGGLRLYLSSLPAHGVKVNGWQRSSEKRKADILKLTGRKKGRDGGLTDGTVG